MTTISFNATEFPKLCDQFYKSDSTSWITFLRNLDCKFQWNPNASDKKYVEMNESDYTMFALRWL
jgi:hypothetical protein